MLPGVPRTVLKNMNLSGNLTFLKHIFLLPIVLPIGLPIAYYCRGSGAGPAWVLAWGARVLGRTGLGLAWGARVLGRTGLYD